MELCIRCALLAGALIAAGAGAAMAQMEAPPPPDVTGAGAERTQARMADRIMDEFDLNHDGKVTHDKYNRTIAAHFAQIAGKTPTISEDQFIAANMKDLRARSDAMFHRLDWNGEGRLSLDEFLQPARARFELADRDGTGTVSCAQPQQSKGGSDQCGGFRRHGFGGFAAAARFAPTIISTRTARSTAPNSTRQLPSNSRPRATATRSRRNSSTASWSRTIATARARCSNAWMPITTES
jgi:hypothetical protein